MAYQLTRYRVQVNTIFSFQNEFYQPGKDYQVTEEIYNSTLPDGRKFADLCDSAQLENISVGG